MTALTDRNTVKIALGIPTADTSEDSLIDQLISECSNLIEEECGRTFGLNNWVEILCGNGQQYLDLRNRPISLYYWSGSTVAGSEVVHTETAGLVEGMPVVGDGIPSYAVISEVNPTSGTITLSVPATKTQTVQLYFGLSVWLDEGALFGQAVGAFPASTMLTPGIDFALDVDQPDGYTSRSGLIYCNNGPWPMPFTYSPGRISPDLGPRKGNVLVHYTAGYASVPTDIQLACNLMIARVRKLSIYGEALTAERDEVFSYNLKSAAKLGLISPEVSSRLARYRNVGVG
jgi:hypothetical protein